MTMTNANPPARGRRASKFTPQAVGKIRGFVAQGISREDIANRLGVTVGSLQVTCSRLGISLRRDILPNGSGCHTDMREQKEVSQPAACAAPLAKLAIMMRYKGKEQTTDIQLPSATIEVLALEAISRDLDIARLIGQILVAVINKDTIQKILRNEVPPSSV